MDDGQGVGAVRNAEIGLVNGDLVGDEAVAVAVAAAAHPPVGRYRAVPLGMARGHVRADGVEVSVAKLPSTWRERGFCNLWAWKKVAAAGPENFATFQEAGAGPPALSGGISRFGRARDTPKGPEPPRKSGRGCGGARLRGGALSAGLKKSHV